MISVLTKPFKYFFKLESASGLVLLFAAAIALIISNSDYDTIYFGTLKKYISIGFGSFSLKLSVIHWINDVLMTVFFFLVSLEIKRELVQGELSNPKQALLPIIGAVGGMVVPALFYIIINNFQLYRPSPYIIILIVSKSGVLVNVCQLNTISRPNSSLTLL